MTSPPAADPALINILAVDDRPENLLVMRNILDELPGIAIVTAQSGQEALRRVLERSFGLILLDVQMPDMDGFEVASLIRQHPKCQRIPIIFVTAISREGKYVFKGYQSGAVDYIAKPIDPFILQSKVKVFCELQSQRQRLEAANAELLAQAEELRRRKRETEEALELLRQTQEQLVQSEKMAALSQLVAGVAHEINTPLGIGVTAASHLDERTAEMLRVYRSGSMRRSDLESYLSVSEEVSRMLLVNLNRAAELVRSFKQVAVDQASSERRRFKLGAYLGEIMLSLHPKLKGTGHKVAIECPEDFEMDSLPGPLAQIITNFVMNSLLHGFEGVAEGHISIRAASADGFALVTYSDDGRGIPEENLKKIYDPFFTTKRGCGGSGLGLHIVYNLVTQALKGSIVCRSEPGKGVSFELRLPLRLPDTASAAPG